MFSEKCSSPVSDAELLKRAASGIDQNALPSLMARYEWIKAVLYRILHNREDVKDAWQDTCVKVLECLNNHSYLKIDHFGVWLYRTAVNFALMKKRHDKNMRHDEAALFMAENRGEEYCNMPLDENDAETMLRTLGPHTRAVVRKRIIEEKTVKETARELHISEGTVKSACNRGLAKLKRNKGM